MVKILTELLGDQVFLYILLYFGKGQTLLFAYHFFELQFTCYFVKLLFLFLKICQLLFIVV